VVFRGNGFSWDAQAADFALMRAAELCQGKGYDQLVVTAESLTHDQLGYYDTTAMTMIDSGVAPVATVVVTCLKTAGEGSQPVVDIIAAVKGRHTENMPK